MYLTRTYASWIAMKSRCVNPKDKKWAFYGGAGVTVCIRWQYSFENFLADMGERPAGHTLDRKDGDKGYQKDNCRWATPKQQNNNLSNNVRLALDGVTKTLPQWAEIAGLKPNTLRYRLFKLNWPLAKAIATPVKQAA